MTVTNVTPPTISGTTVQGNALHATSGTWTYDQPSISYAYQWERCDAGGANCVDIANATASSYILAAADVGNTLRVRVTATEGPPPSGEPPAIAGKGYSVVFEDDFDSFDTSVWSRKIWYDPNGDAPAPDMFCSGSLLNLINRRADNYPNRTVTTRISSSQTRTWIYGYFECNMKWPAGQGAFPAFWLFSQHWADTGTVPPYVGEIDIMEGQGGASWLAYTNNALHRNTGGAGGVPDSGANVRYTWADRGFGDLTSDFHTYALLWTSTALTWYLDDVQTFTCAPFDSTPQQMFMLIDGWIGGWEGSYDGTTPDVLTTQVDWVRVWQK